MTRRIRSAARAVTAAVTILACCTAAPATAQFGSLGDLVGKSSAPLETKLRTRIATVVKKTKKLPKRPRKSRCNACRMRASILK